MERQARLYRRRRKLLHLPEAVLKRSYLYLPQSVGAGCRCGRLSQGGPQEDMEFTFILVTRQELFLLGVKEANHVPLK